MGLWDEPACLPLRQEFVDLSSNCSSWGVDIAEDVGQGDTAAEYNETGCTLCSTFFGAVPRRVLSSTPKVTCQRKCDADAGCAAYDFDLTRSMCRLWAACPACARAPMNCPWNVYEKPNAVHVATSSPSGGHGCGFSKTIIVDVTTQEEESTTSEASNHSQVVALAVSGGWRPLQQLTPLAYGLVALLATAALQA